MSYNVGFTAPVKVLNFDEIDTGKETLSEVAENTDLILKTIGNTEDAMWDGESKAATVISLLKSIVNKLE